MEATTQLFNTTTQHILPFPKSLFNSRSLPGRKFHIKAVDHCLFAPISFQARPASRPVCSLQASSQVSGAEISRSGVAEPAGEGKKVDKAAEKKGFGPKPQQRTNPKPKEGKMTEAEKQKKLKMLKKMEVDMFKALAEGVGKLLAGTSLYIIGSNSEANADVAEALARVLGGYTPVHVASLLQQTTSRTPAQLESEEGHDEVAAAEASAFATLSTFVRLVVATMGGAAGAARDQSRWNHLYGVVTVWLDCGEPIEGFSEEGSIAAEWSKRRSEAAASGMGYHKTDVYVRVPLTDGRWRQDVAPKAANGVLEALRAFLERDKEIIGKKSYYTRLGCRGDWPDLKPPGWDPNAPEGSEASTPLKEIWVGNKDEVERVERGEAP